LFRDSREEKLLTAFSGRLWEDPPRLPRIPTAGRRRRWCGDQGRHLARTLLGPGSCV